MNLLKSIFTYSCPKCRTTKMFTDPLKLKDPLSMHDACNNCGQNFEPEPGFWYGAMFISYIVSGWILLLLALFMVFVLDWNFDNVAWIIIGVGLLFFLKTIRLSRSIWIHIVVKYNDTLHQKFKKEPSILRKDVSR